MSESQEVIRFECDAALRILSQGLEGIPRHLREEHVTTALGMAALQLAIGFAGDDALPVPLTARIENHSSETFSAYELLNRDELLHLTIASGVINLVTEAVRVITAEQIRKNNKGMRARR